MSRQGSDRLATLLKLAAMREQRAARAFAAEADRLRQASQQSQQLQQYSDEYEQQFAARASQPLSVRQLMHDQGFFRQLTDIQAQQQHAVAQREGECEASRQQWMALYARRRLLDQLRARRQQHEQVEREKKLQRELDDRLRLNNGWDAASGRDR